MYLVFGVLIGYFLCFLINFFKEKIKEKREREEWKEFDSFFE